MLRDQQGWRSSYLIFLLQVLTGLWFSWVSKGRIGELAPSSQDLKGWKKHNKDGGQHPPQQRSENIPFPAFLQPLQLGLSTAIPLKKLTVIPSGKLTERILFAINQVTQIPTILRTPFKPENRIYVCCVFLIIQITVSCKSVSMHLFNYSAATFSKAMTGFTWYMKSTCYLQNEWFYQKLSATNGKERNHLPCLGNLTLHCIHKENRFGKQGQANDALSLQGITEQKIIP